MWERGDIIQINPEHDPAFGGCLMVVDEPKSWGAQGYVSIPGRGGGQVAFYRLAHDKGEKVGHAVWLIPDAESMDEAGER